MLRKLTRLLPYLALEGGKMQLFLRGTEYIQLLNLSMPTQLNFARVADIELALNSRSVVLNNLLGLKTETHLGLYLMLP